MKLMTIDFQEIKNKFFTKITLLSFIIILVTFFTDRYSKIKILNNFSNNVYYINNFVNFDLVWNTGIGFGLFSFDSNLYYNLITILILVVIISLVIVSFKFDNIDKIIFSVIIGGALGNFYDRVTFKAVPDFIDLHYVNFHWFTFNVADIFITIGIISFLIKGFLIKN
tara:strand:- start:475 stop:978 length:504 start_codon:yes stop_codon:yes gene_type:complete